MEPHTEGCHLSPVGLIVDLRLCRCVIVEGKLQREIRRLHKIGLVLVALWLRLGR